MLSTKFDSSNNTHTIHFPSTEKYLTSSNIGDLPHNAYIDKGVTGCGGTTLALTNDQNYIVAVPMKRLVTNKELQHSNVYGFHGDKAIDDLKFHIDELGYTKIIVTYDSLQKVIDNIDVSKFRLLIDEAQLLIQYGGKFKSRVCNDVFKAQRIFKSVSYITATPTQRKYLPDGIKDLDYYEFHWENAKLLKMNVYYASRDINNKVLTFVLASLDKTDKNVFVFFNSIAGITQLTKLLLKAKPEMKIGDVSIMVADSKKNTEHFKRAFGKNFEFAEPIIKNGSETIYTSSKVTFVSSMGFQGMDFYSDKDVISLIVSDSKKKSMRYDAYIDIPQIAGRFRKHPITGFEPKNNLYFVWTGYTTDINVTEEDYEQSVLKNIDYSKELLNISAKADTLDAKELLTTWEITKPFIIVDDDEKPLIEREFEINNLAYSSCMSTYSSLHADFRVNNVDSNSDDFNDTPIVIDKISDCFNTSTFTIPQLSPKYQKLINKSSSYTNIAREYCEVYEKMMTSISVEDRQEYIEELENLKSMNLDLSKHLEAFKPLRIKNHSYSKSRVEKDYIEYCKKLDCGDVIYKNFSVDGSYTVNDIKLILMEIQIDLSHRDLKLFFNLKQTTKFENSKIVPAYKIISKKELNND